MKTLNLNCFERELASVEKTYARVWKELDREAKADRCAGDIVCGWDWPTLRMVKPQTFRLLQELILRAKALRRISNTADGIR